MPAEQAKRGVESVTLGRLCARMSACLRDVFAIYDNNISPRLIMTIIKIGIRYFKQITHSDDFPLTGIQLVHT